MDSNHYWVLEDADEYGYHYKCPICKHTYVTTIKNKLPSYCIFCNQMIMVNRDE